MPSSIASRAALDEPYVAQIWTVHLNETDMKTTTREKQRRQWKLQQRDSFIKAVAEFVVADMARKSIELEMDSRGTPKPDALAWAKIKNHIGASGYPTKEEAELAIRDLFGL
jgi:hypothetical protein